MIKKLAQLLSSRSNAFVIHGNGDPDALASAYALASVFRGEIIAPEGLDRLSKRLAENLSIEVSENLDLDRFERTVILDTSGPEQLGRLHHLSDDKNAIVIDHHKSNSRWAADIYYCDEEKSSCCEIVYQIITASGQKLKRKVALALLAGMLTDSGHFRYGNAETLRVFSKIMTDFNMSMHDVMSLVEAEIGLSEKISQLRGAQRLKYSRVDKFIIATSFGSAFESSVGKSLVALGADIAFVGSQRGSQFRISARASADVVKMGIHLGKLLDGIAKDSSAGGGGHPGAAGLSGKGSAKYMLNLCLHQSRKALKSLIPDGK